MNTIVEYNIIQLNHIEITYCNPDFPDPLRAGTGIPFDMILKSNGYKAEAAVRAMRELSREAEKNGTAN